MSHWHQSSFPGIGDPFKVMWGPNGVLGDRSSVQWCDHHRDCVLHENMLGRGVGE